LDQAQKWISLVNRVKNGEMPPKGAPAPSMDLREQFTNWVDTTLRTEACSAGIQPGPAVTRRMNRDEYMATVSDLLRHAHGRQRRLPVDGAGGEGFDNAAETSSFRRSTPRSTWTSRNSSWTTRPRSTSPRQDLHRETGSGVTPRKQRSNPAPVPPRAFRRPITDADIAPYQSLFDASYLKTKDFEPPFSSR
jgi:hypothetical protein